MFKNPILFKANKLDRRCQIARFGLTFGGLFYWPYKVLIIIYMLTSVRLSIL